MSEDPRQKYISAQCSVIGSMLIDGQVVGAVLHRLGEQHFSGEYRTIYQAIRKLFASGRPVDAVTVGAALGPEYTQLLVEIMDATPTAANVNAYVDIVRDEARRIALNDCGVALANCRDLDLAAQIIAKINRITADQQRAQIMTMEQGLADFYRRQQASSNAIPWGIDKLDLTVQSEPGDFVVVGGYPSAGKTALSLQLAWAQATDKRVGYFSLETKPSKLFDRTVALATGVDFGSIRRHELNDADWATCAAHVVEIKGQKLEIIQSGGMSVPEIQALALAGRYEVIYVDYLQLVRAESTRASEFEQVTQVSKALHTLAQTTGIMVVALSQLTRPNNANGKSKAPGLHSLRQSGQIEQDADAVMLLYLEQDGNPAGRRILRVAKNKDGRAGGSLSLDFDGRRQRFSPIVDGREVQAYYSTVGRAAKEARRAKAKMEAAKLEELQDDDPNMPF